MPGAGAQPGAGGITVTAGPTELLAASSQRAPTAWSPSSAQATYTRTYMHAYICVYVCLYIPA